jgi:Tfp pilus assembly protein PilN
LSAPLNLARRPFANARPVTRVALLLWLLGGLLLLGNVFLFWSYLAGSSEKRAELARLEEEVERQQRAVAQLDARLAGLDLGQQNEQVAFLNRKIAERTFSWSLLFDRLAQVLPDGVRLMQLQPAPIGGNDRLEARPGARPAPTRPIRRNDREAGSSDRVPLIVQGESKSDEALYQFVDKLFAHPAFDDPDISRETRDEDKGNVIRFDLRVTYIPAAGPQEVTVEEAPTVVEEPTPAPAPSASPPAEPPATDSRMEE